MDQPNLNDTSLARSDHGCAKIDDNRILIVGGFDSQNALLSSCLIYDVRTKQSTPLPNDLPAALSHCCVVANENYVYVIGGHGPGFCCNVVNTMYRLSLETLEWTTMAPMDTARTRLAATLKDNYIYVFGGNGNLGLWLSSTERYSIENNTWEDLPYMARDRCFHCALSTSSEDIYIVGGLGCNRSIEVFDSATLQWKTDLNLRDMPEARNCAAVVLVRDRYLVLIGGDNEEDTPASSCLIYDICSNLWSSTPEYMNTVDTRCYHTAAVLDDKIIVVGGIDDNTNNVLSSVECIHVDALLQYAPLHYPLPPKYLERIILIGKGKCDRVQPK